MQLDRGLGGDLQFVYRYSTSKEVSIRIYKEGESSSRINSNRVVGVVIVVEIKKKRNNRDIKRKLE